MTFVLFATQHLAQQTCELDGVVNSAIETEPANRVVDVRCVAREKTRPWLKRAATRWWTL
jgi:hypothetical protein